MGNVITEYEQTGDSPGWSRDYIYGDRGELLAFHLPRTAAMNAAFDSLVSFAEAWLCDPNCPQGLLVWDTVADGFIDYLDYADNIATFEGAFATNYRYVITDKDNSAIGVARIDGSITYIDYDAWGSPSYSGDIDGLNILWNGYYFDSETGNYYLKNRYYSPIERRFLTEDPHGIIPDENWNNPFGILNQYADGVGLTVYAGFNPVNGRDDWGLDAEELTSSGNSEKKGIYSTKSIIGLLNPYKGDNSLVKPISDPYPSCVAEGFYRHCLNTCVFTRFLGPIPALIGAGWAGGDFPWSGAPDYRDWEANLVGSWNAFNIFSTCTKSCLKSYDKAVERHCCTNNIMKRKGK